MAEALVSSAVQRLGDLLTKEADLLSGVEGHVKRLQTELRKIKGFLRDADARKEGDERVRNWIAEIRDAAYDAEDVTETFILKSASKGEEGVLNAVKRYGCILADGIGLCRVRSDLEALRVKVSNLTSSLQKYGITESGQVQEGSISLHQNQNQLSYPRFLEHTIVGLEDDTEKLVSLLVAEEMRQLKVVSICGADGLGKTTLAKKVYHHIQVRRHFKDFIWVNCSLYSQVRDILTEIAFHRYVPPKEQGLKLDRVLYDPFEESRDGMLKANDDEVATKVYDGLRFWKYLVVLDDIPDGLDWSSLIRPFPKDDYIAILVTSRHKDAVPSIDPNLRIYEPPHLNDEWSWELFKKIALSGQDCQGSTIDPGMEELGKEMVRHCTGFPLAIRMLGGLLSRKGSLDEWRMVQKSIEEILLRANTLDVLALSYVYLPLHLKSCLMYLSFFPKDYEIPVRKVIHLWVAEGFVSSMQREGEGNDDEEKSREDVAESYLTELVERGLVRVGERDASLRVKSCYVHGLVREFCLSRAEQEDFLRVVDHWGGNETAHNVSSSPIERACRILVHLHRGNGSFSLKSIKYPQQLRSLLFRNKYKEMQWDLLEPIFENFKVLRVLDLEGGRVREGGFMLPMDIGKVTHLRFLSLQNCQIHKLPQTLGNLRFLQILDLRNSIGIMHVLPNTLYKLEWLRHLYFPIDCPEKTRLLLSTLIELRTLVNFPARNCDAKELLNMTHLRELSIRWPLAIEGFREFFESLTVALKSLQSLALCDNPFGFDSKKLEAIELMSGFPNLQELTLYVPLERLPECQQFPPAITYIYLEQTRLKEDPMPTLERLPNLRILRLYLRAYIGREMVCSANGFPQLHRLVLDGQRKLVEWTVQEGAFPNLYYLKVVRCKRLKGLPDGLKFVTSLKELEVKSMEYDEKLEPRNEEFYKIQHVPIIGRYYSN